MASGGGGNRGKTTPLAFYPLSAHLLPCPLKNMTNFSSGVLCRSLQKCLAIYLHFLFISLSLFGSPYHPLAPSVLAALEFASPISGMSLLPAHPPTLVTPIFYAFSIVSARPVCIFHFGTHILLSSKVDRGFGEVSLSLCPCYPIPQQHPYPCLIPLLLTPAQLNTFQVELSFCKVNIGNFY